MRIQNLIGKRFGILRVIKFAGIKSFYGTRRSGWVCKCDCGVLKAVSGIGLIRGHSKSCGCRQHIGRPTKHGACRTPEYKSWRKMKERCLNRRHVAYKHYGGRGIKICERWMQFENFFADMGAMPSPLYTLERKNNSGHYTKSNCRWATRKEQANNRTNSHFITRQGKTQTVSQWAVELGVGRDRIYAMERRGEFHA